MDAADGLQISSDFQEAEYYLLSTCEFYGKLGPDVGTEHIETFTGLILIQCSNRSKPYVDEPLLDKSRTDTLTLQPLRFLTLTRIALSHMALRWSRNAHQLYSLLDLEDKALRGALFSRENWKLIITGLGDEVCNLAALGVLEHAERLFILAEKLALKEMGAAHWWSMKSNEESEDV